MRRTSVREEYVGKPTVKVKKGFQVIMMMCTVEMKC